MAFIVSKKTIEIRLNLKTDTNYKKTNTDKIKKSFQF